MTEVERGGGQGQPLWRRDAAMAFVAYRHGLRAAELVDPRLGEQGNSERPPCTSGESSRAALASILSSGTSYAPTAASARPGAQITLRVRLGAGAPFTTAGFARMIERAGIEAKLGFKAHPHMLRHACGYALANKGHDTRALQAYLGHPNIQHTVRYTELSPTRFKDFWRS
jgi:site-specific recombinase XerD